MGVSSDDKNNIEPVVRVSAQSPARRHRFKLRADSDAECTGQKKHVSSIVEDGFGSKCAGLVQR